MSPAMSARWVPSLHFTKDTALNDQTQDVGHDDAESILRALETTKHRKA